MEERTALKDVRMAPRVILDSFEVPHLMEGPFKIGKIHINRPPTGAALELFFS